MRTSLYVIVLFLSCASAVLSDSSFRIGVVGSSSIQTRDEDALNGYHTFRKKINADNDGRGFSIKDRNGRVQFYYQYDLVGKDDGSDPMVHEEALRELIHHDGVDFMVGTHPRHAALQMQITNASGILDYHCCVEPASMYDHDYKTVFGISTPSTDYTKSIIRAFSLHNVQNVAVLFDTSNIFTRQICETAMAFGRDLFVEYGYEIGNTVFSGFDASTADAAVFTNLAQRIKKKEIEVAFGCFFPEESKKMVEALHRERYPLKGFMLTMGPGSQEWIDELEPAFLADDLLSAAQWHRHLKYQDPLFDSTANYAEVYLHDHGVLPTSHSAAATAVGVTLTQAIKNAFVDCDISKTAGDVNTLLYDPDAIECSLGPSTLRGYDRVQRALAELDMETAFGPVKFDLHRQNRALTPVATQVVRKTSLNNTVYREIEAVLPVGYATELLRFPATNYYKETCQPGTYKSSDPYIACHECSKGESSDVENAIRCDSCPIGEWNNMKGQMKCNACPQGTSTSQKGVKSIRDCFCEEGYFQSNGLPGIPCEMCPIGAKCPGGTDLPIPLPGFWANGTLRHLVHPCDPPGVCLGGQNSACKDGHTGRLCGECIHHFFKSMDSCFECPSRGLIVLLCLALLVSWYVINVTVSRSVTSLEIILSWAQLANIIGDINSNWTSRVSTMFGVANILDFDVDFLEPSCVVKWGFKENFITQLLLPLVMTAMAATGFLGSAMAYIMVRKRWIREEGFRKSMLSIFVDVPSGLDELQEKWDSTIATFLASVDMTYVTIAKYCFDVFKCEEIGGVSVLSEAPDVVCGTADHGTLIGLACFGIALYVIGYQLLVICILIILSTRCTFSHGVNLRRFGFIYEKFELDYAFTPAINLVRKLLFVSVLVYVNNPAFQIGLLAIILIASLIVHVYCAPYVDTQFDVLYSFLLIALVCEAFGGLMFYSENLPDANRQILEWIVLTSFLLLIVVFAAILFLEMIKKYHIHYIQNAHKKFIRRNLPKRDILAFAREAYRTMSLKQAASLWTVRSFGSFGSQKHREEIGHELLSTFRPSFIYNCLRKNPNFIESWDKLCHMLKHYISDQSVTSYLSMETTAKFWRRLVDHLPELVDFLAVADDNTREAFKDVATNLYRNFYLSNKVAPLPLMEIVNWRDYAPIAQWLATASPQNRSFFIDHVSAMFAVNGKTEASDVLESKKQHGGRDPHLEKRATFGRWNEQQEKILKRIYSGSTPFHHPAAEPTGEIGLDDSPGQSHEPPTDPSPLTQPETAQTEETTPTGSPQENGQTEIVLDNEAMAEEQERDQTSSDRVNKSVSFVE